MLELIKHAGFVTAYWLTLPLIGYGLLVALKTAAKESQSVQKSIEVAIGHNAALGFLSTTTVTLSVLGVWSIFCYLFQAPASVFTSFYVLLLGMTLVWLLWSSSLRVPLRLATKKILLTERSPLVRITFCVAVVLIVLDLVISLYVKSYVAVSADSYVHLARIVTMLSGGFTTASGYFIGAPDIGYHYNLIYALYLPPAQLFGLHPAVVWEYSLGFFRLVLWTGIFSLAWHVCKYWLNDKKNVLLFASAATVFAVSYFSSTFFIAVYPDQAVLAWLILLVIVVSTYEMRRGISPAAIVLTTFVITLIHPSFALMSAMLLALICTFKFIFKDTRSNAMGDLKSYTPAIIVAMTGPILTMLYPRRTSIIDHEVGSFPVWNIGPLSLKQLPAIWTGTPLKLIFVFLGTLGLFLLLYKLWKLKHQWVIAAALILFFPLIAYEPIGFSVLRTVMPLWAIGRFSSLNVLSLISVTLGVYGLLSLVWIGRRDVPLLARIARPHTMISIGILVVGALSAIYYVQSYRSLLAYRQENKNYYSFIDRTYDSFHMILKDKKTILASPGDSYFLASVMPLNVITVEPGHMTPTVDTVNRQACQRMVMRQMDLPSLKAIGADYIVLATYDPQYAVLKRSADARPFLRQAASNANFVVYRVAMEGYTTTEKPYSSCLAYRRAEAH